jgi:IS5 family transposase
VDFKGEKRSNESHASVTDAESRLLRKGPGKEAKLTFAAHALMDNRHGLITDLSVTPSVGVTEPAAALALLARQRKKHLRPKSVGGDKGYHTRAFVAALRARGIKPHVARKDAHTTPGLDGRTTRSRGYQISQVARKRIEQVFGWGKTIGGLRKTRLKGVARTQHLARLTGAAYNLLRISRLCPVTG